MTKVTVFLVKEIDIDSRDVRAETVKEAREKAYPLFEKIDVNDSNTRMEVRCAECNELFEDGQIDCCEEEEDG